jgi:hypothetical protein
MTYLADGFAPDGEPHRVSADDVIASARANSSGRIPMQHFLGSAQHESDLTVNERTAEGNGQNSDGLYQLNFGEAVRALRPDANLLDIDDNTLVFATLADARLTKCVGAANDYNAANGLAALDETNLPPDIWAYVAIAHNQGDAAAVKSISTYGLDWNAYQSRNASVQGVAEHLSYYADAISGGSYWRDEFGAPSPAGGTGYTLRAGIVIAGLGLLAYKFIGRV